MPGIGHASAMKLLRKYTVQIQSFGEVRFEIRLNKQGSSTEYALLNEHQSLFFLTLMRNSASVVDFKQRLICEFIRMAERLRNRDMTMWQKRIALETRDTSSLAKAQVGSKLEQRKDAGNFSVIYLR
jgi:phage regulator Rha-like protein